MGSPLKEPGRYDNENQHKKRIGRTFAVAAQSVTWEQYNKFAPENKKERQDRQSPSLDCPVNYISWFMAAKYCNWLSKQDGIGEEQWCYEIKGEEIKLKANYLSLTGYRLPTEAEMEYATRAGAITSRYYGETEELLPKYAWYFKNSQQKTWSVGSLKPNDWGLFDVLGNVPTWCQEKSKSYPQSNLAINEDKEDMYSINIIESRALRGGSFVGPASLVRSSYRNLDVPANRYITYGFRPARTFTP
jgi:formylglycine-generating enzyme required for sulfatase activity